MTEQTETVAVAILADAEYTDTGVLEVRHPITKALTGWKVTFAGPGHPKTIKENDRALDEVLQTAKAQEMSRVNNKKWKSDDQSVAEARREFARSIAVRILDWSPVDFQDGKGAVSFSENNAIDLMLDPKRSWIAPQFREYLDGEKSFTKGSVTA
jgi:hypothetical protein